MGFTSKICLHSLAAKITQSLSQVDLKHQAGRQAGVRANLVIVIKTQVTGQPPCLDAVLLSVGNGVVKPDRFPDYK